MNQIKTITVLFISFFLVAVLFAQPRLPEREIHYRPGDWVSYPVMRFATCVAADFRTVYFGTTNGIARYNFYDDAWDVPFTRSDGLESDHIRLMGYDFNSGYLWAVTGSGISMLLPGTNQWQNLPLPPTGSGAVTSLGFGREHAWLERGGVFFKGSRFGGPFTGAQKGEADQDNVEWKGALARQAGPSSNFFMEDNYLFLPTGIIQDRNLRQYKITDTFADRFEKLWMSVWGLGGAVADLKTSRVKLMPFGSYVPEAHAMEWDGDGMWIGGVRSKETDEGGITFWDMKANRWLYFESGYIPSLRNDNVTSIAVDSTTVWFGTEDGLVSFNKENQRWNVLNVLSNLWSNTINNLSLGHGCLWVATESGINRVRLPSPAVERVEDPRLRQRVIYDISADGANAWACTDRGIFHYDESKGGWNAVGGWPGIVSHTITAVCVYGNEVWFGTGDGVEVYYKVENRWEGFPAFHYPTAGLINAIAANDSSVWFGTEDGVLKYKKSEKRWRRFSTEDGLLNDSVQNVLLDGDYVWFGTAKGLTRFYWNASYRVD